jgi:hypothetical protein
MGKVWSLRGGCRESDRINSKQKRIPDVAMKSGWVESGRRTTLYCYLFGSCHGWMGTAKQPALALGKRSTSQTHDASAASVSHAPADLKPDGTEDCPSRLVDVKTRPLSTIEVRFALLAGN